MKHFAFICLSFSGSNYFLPVHRLCKWNPASILRITAIFVGEWEGGRGQWQLITVLCSPGRERSNYWFNSQPWPHTDSPFYGSTISQNNRNNCVSREGREVSIDLIHAPWPTLTHHSTAGELVQERKEGLHQILYCVHTYVWYCISMQEDTA